jgi:hypothetical protein
VTVAATLQVRVLAAGFLGRLRHAFRAPSVVLDGDVHDARAGRVLRLAVAPGSHELTVRDGERTASTVVELGPGGTVTVEARVSGGDLTLAVGP